jgi:hypothetical protein
MKLTQVKHPDIGASMTVTNYCMLSIERDERPKSREALNMRPSAS